MMKVLYSQIILMCLVFSVFRVNAQNIGINEDGSDPDDSAILDISSTNKGVLLPRLTTVQRGNIVSPAKGLTVFDTDENSIMIYDGASWQRLSQDGEGLWTLNGAHQYSSITGNVGIGVSLPSNKLTVYDNTASSSTMPLFIGQDSGWEPDEEVSLGFGDAPANLTLSKISNYYSGGNNRWGLKFYTYNGTLNSSSPILTLTGQNSVGIGNADPDQSAILDMSSSNKGFLPPRLNNTERNGISNPAVGLTIYNTDTLCMETYTGYGWSQYGCCTPFAEEPTAVTALPGEQGAYVSFTHNNEGSYSVISNPGGIVTTGSTSGILVAGLTDGQDYTFRVVSHTKCGHSDTSMTTNTVTPCSPMATTPINPLATVYGDSVHVSWTPGNGETSFTVSSNPAGYSMNVSSSPAVFENVAPGNYTFNIQANTLCNSESITTNSVETIVTYKSTEGITYMTQPYEDRLYKFWPFFTSMSYVAKSVDDGAANTNILVTTYPTTSTGVKYCHDLNYGGYTDWFLPAPAELDTMYNHRLELDGFHNEYASSMQIPATATSSSYHWVRNFLVPRSDPSAYSSWYVAHSQQYRCIRKDE